MDALFHIPRHHRPKEGWKQKISLQIPSNIFMPSVTLMLLLKFSGLSKPWHCFLISWTFIFRFRFKTVFFDYLLWIYVHFLQISLLRPPEVAYSQKALYAPAGIFDFSSCFWLVLFMRVVKWSLRLRAVCANSLQLFKFSAIFCHMVPLSLLLDLFSNIPFLAIPLIIWMSFPIFTTS